MTNKENLELARWAVKEALKQGAQEASANVSSSRSVEVEVRASKVDKLQESVRHGLSISLYIDHKYSSHSTNDLRRDSAARFIGEAVAMTRHLSADEFRRLPEPKLYFKGREPRDLGRLDPSFAKMDTAGRIRRAKAIEAAGARVSDKIISVEAACSDSLGHNAKVHSNGFEGEEETTSFNISAGVTVNDGQGGRPEDYAYAYARQFTQLPQPESIGKEAADRALRKIGQRKIASGKYDLLVENRVAARLLGPFLGAATGQALQQKQSFLEGMLGKAIASEKLTITEDPFIPGGFDSQWFDYEGVATRKRAVIGKGVLKTWYIDPYYGRKLSMEPTLGWPTNLVFELGAKDRQALVKSISRGILVTNFIGGNSNATTGDFSYGIMGDYIENGEVRHAVNEMNISGNLKDLWRSLDALGNDPFPYGGWRTPTLYFRNVQFSGL